MKLKSAHITKFKRFSDLNIIDLPEDARLVILLGPNGCGKSSLFEAFLTELKTKRFYGFNSDSHSYYDRKTDINKRDARNDFKQDLPNRLKLQFHGHNPTTQHDYRKSMYLRTAYRHEAHFRSRSLSTPSPLLEEHRFTRLIDEDRAVQVNYQRLVWQILGKVMTPGLTTDAIMNETIGVLQDVMKRVFGNLALDNLVSPDENGTFTFSKGVVTNFLYENLSGGEKAAFDLLLDLIVSRSQYDDSLYCIDEPEAHLNTRLQSQVLQELYNLIPANSQLWIATHSIGMVRKAEELRFANPSQVVFLDFGFRPDGQPRNFDHAETIRPSVPDFSFWSRHYDVALDDLSKLVAPERIVFCEGSREGGNAAFDSACYNKIFSTKHPRTVFIPIGSSTDVENRMLGLVPVLEQVVTGTEVILLRDRDDMSEPELQRRKPDNIRVLTGYRNLESLILSDDVLALLCESHNVPDELENLIAARSAALLKDSKEDRPQDDYKPAAQAVHHATKKHLKLSNSGSKKEDFMLDFLVPVIRPETSVYSAIEEDIFGSPCPRRAPG